MTSESKSRAVLARLSLVGIWLGMALLALMAGLVVLQVGARNLADLGLPWADELARFCSIGLVFIGIPALAGRQALVSVSILPDMLGARGRKGLTLVSDLATLGFCILLLWGFAEFLPRAGKFMTPALQLPNYFYYSLALLGSAFLCLVSVYRVANVLRGRAPSHGFPDAADQIGPIE